MRVSRAVTSPQSFGSRPTRKIYLPGKIRIRRYTRDSADVFDSRIPLYSHNRPDYNHLVRSRLARNLRCRSCRRQDCHIPKSRTRSIASSAQTLQLQPPPPYPPQLASASS